MDLTARVVAPLTPEDRRRVQIAAAESGLSIGAFARALVLAGVDRTDDPVVAEAIAAEAESVAARRSEAGRQAVSVRYQKE